MITNIFNLKLKYVWTVQHKDGQTDRKDHHIDSH